MDDKDIAWLAGLLEGEGSFMKGPPSRPRLPIVILSMTDEDVVLRASKMFGVGYIRSRRGEARGWKNSFITKVVGKRALLVMKAVYPHMGSRRKKQIEEAFQSYRKESNSKLSEEVAAEIRRRCLGPHNVSHLAKEFGVSRAAIRNVRCGKAWNHGPIAHLGEHPRGTREVVGS